MSDDVAVMSNGQIVQYGTPEELYHHPKNKEVATFIGRNLFRRYNPQSSIKHK